ncbi:NAD-dependent epimerase/dehydratase family protein [Micromonospora sp. WMMD975]|uniref:NAD-dependent epimerase/dehydratase family protein n=1 Tax=Micromonospora sp. WMMD975 TaxID=3016087 RepID=UPI002499CACE|nr:NAD-dependent epimerase/dehydratase family protein [Micromonospora sp. WMMD975]WFE32694.1 NAD-dependent epimerase/dehydratase family protein [Micromonospora sp. WMMD975]
MSTLIDSDIDDICVGLGEYAQRFDGKRVLITGARGFVGQYLTAVFRRLNAKYLREPCQVLAMDNLRTPADGSATPLEDPHITFVEHDVVLPFSPGGKVDFVVHAAGIASPYYYRKFPLETMDVATHGLRNMLDVARADGARLLFLSSSEIYGNPDATHVPTAEDYNGNVSCLGPRSCYDESKRFGETLLQVYVQQFGVEAVIVRPFNVYGPGLSREDYRIMPNIAVRLSTGEAIDVYGDGTQTRTFCYATDAIVGFLLALLRGRPGEAYNVGASGPEVSIIDLLELVRDSVPAPDLKYTVRDYPDSYPGDEPMRRCPDLVKAFDHLGYEPTVPFTDGLRKFITWSQEYYR